MDNEEQRSLDRQVAHAMGYNVSEWPMEPEPYIVTDTDPYLRYRDLPYYSTDWTVLPEMLDWLIDHNWMIDLYHNGHGWEVALSRDHDLWKEFPNQDLLHSVCEAIIAVIEIN